MLFPGFGGLESMLVGYLGLAAAYQLGIDRQLTVRNVISSAVLNRFSFQAESHTS